MRLLQVNEELSRFIFYPPRVGSGAVSLSAADVSNMWRHVCFMNPFPPFFLEFKAFSPPLRAAARSTSSTLLHHSQIRGSWRRKPVSCREAEGVVTELWSPRIVTINSLCSSVTTADTAFSLPGLEAGLWAFRLRMFTTCDDMLFRNPFPLFLFWIPSMFQKFIPAIPFWTSKHPIIPIPTRSLRLLRATARFISSALWLHHAHPFVAATEKNQSHAEKQRVWSRSCALQDLLRTIQWLCPRLGLQDIHGALSCDTWLLQTNEQLSRLSF